MKKHLHLPPGQLAHGWRQQPDGWLADQYEKHNAHVIANVPQDKLLVFNVKEGWEPLCKFLECEVPSDQDFPHSKVNTKESLIELKQTFERAVYSWIPVVVAWETPQCFSISSTAKGPWAMVLFDKSALC